jgi:hypothetical protein
VIKFIQVQKKKEKKKNWVILKFLRRMTFLMSGIIRIMIEWHLSPLWQVTKLTAVRNIAKEC